MNEAQQIRFAKGEDAEAIARIGAKTWQAAYRGQLPDEYLNSLSPKDKIEQRRKEILEPQSTERYLVATEGGLVTGYCSVGPSRDPDATPSTGELYSIYVDPGKQNIGLGSALMQEGFKYLTSLGFSRATLWVLETNVKTRKWYELKRWKLEGSKKSEPREGFELKGIRYEIELTTPYSCIIPVYNEQSRVSDVLKQVIQVKNLAEIICVDDGSSDNSVSVIKENFPQVRLIQHERNLGKTAAVVTGLSLATGETVLLLDSDLINLKSAEIDKALACFEQNRLDCLLLNTAPMGRVERRLRPLFRFLLLAAGNRIIRKQCLRETLQSGKFESYHLEIAQNKYLMANRKSVGYFDISAVDVSKISKEGFIKGTQSELEMWRQIISYAGLEFFIKQSLFFARRKFT